jgi:hypothetical protein
MSKKGNYKDLVEDRDGNVRALLAVFGFDPIEEHTTDALKQLEELINVHYPQGHEPLPTTLIPFGVYLTKTLLMHLPEAKVDADVESVWDISVSYIPEWSKEEGGTHQIFPFKRVHRFWKNREDAMSALFEMSKLISTTDPRKLEFMADDEGWIRLPSGVMFRMQVGSVSKDGKTKESSVHLDANKIIPGLK